MDPRRRAERLAGAIAGRARAIGAGLVAAAVLAGVLLRHAGVDLGAATAPMFWVRFSEHYRGLPLAHPWWPAVPLAAALGAVLVLLRARRLPVGAYLAGVFGVTLLARFGLNTAQFGTDEWSWPLRRPNSLVTEYPAAYDHVRGHAAAFVDRFAELVPHLPAHPSGHPVGATLAFYALDRATGGPTGTAVVLSVLGAAAVVPTYLLARLVGDERSGRVAAALFALAPQTLLYGTTSYDAAFVPLAALIAWLLLRRTVAAGAALAAVAFLLSYALALVPVFAVLAAPRRERRRIALACAVAIAGLLAALAAGLGYDPIGGGAGDTRRLPGRDRGPAAVRLLADRRPRRVPDRAGPAGGGAIPARRRAARADRRRAGCLRPPRRPDRRDRGRGRADPAVPGADGGGRRGDPAALAAVARDRPRARCRRGLPDRAGVGHDVLMFSICPAGPGSIGAVGVRIQLVDGRAAPILARRYYAADGETSPIVRALAQVPELLPATMPFLAAVLGPSSLDLRTKELVILRVSADAGCSYCIGAHQLAAHDAGVTERESAALLGGLPLSDAFPAEEAAILELADAVAAGGEVDERLLRPVRRSHGDHGLVELVLLAATTLMLNRFCTTLGLPLTDAARARLQTLAAAGDG